MLTRDGFAFITYLHNSPAITHSSVLRSMGEEKLTRIAIVNSDKCKPKKCKQECKRTCPVNRMGKDILFIAIG